MNSDPYPNCKQLSNQIFTHSKLQEPIDLKTCISSALACKPILEILHTRISKKVSEYDAKI